MSIVNSKALLQIVQCSCHSYIDTVPDSFNVSVKSYPVQFTAVALFQIKLDVKLFSISCRISKSILTVAREKWIQQL